MSPSRFRLRFAQGTSLDFHLENHHVILVPWDGRDTCGVLDFSTTLTQGASTVGSGGRGEFRVLEEVLIDLLNRCGVLIESDAVVGRTRSTEGAAATGA